MTQYYSAKTGEFYDSQIHKTLPDDAVEVTAQMPQALLNAMAQSTRIGEPGNVLATRKYVNDVMEENRQQSDQRYWKRDEELFPAFQSGYQILPSGLIMQWGFVEKPPYSGVKVTYPIAFPQAVFSVCATNAGIPGSGIHALNVVVKGTQDFQLYCDFQGSPPAVDGFWLALGY